MENRALVSLACGASVEGAVAWRSLPLLVHSFPQVPSAAGLRESTRAVAVETSAGRHLLSEGTAFDAVDPGHPCTS